MTCQGQHDYQDDTQSPPTANVSSKVSSLQSLKRLQAEGGEASFTFPRWGLKAERSGWEGGGRVEGAGKFKSTAPSKQVQTQVLSHLHTHMLSSHTHALSLRLSLPPPSAPSFLSVSQTTLSVPRTLHTRTHTRIHTRTRTRSRIHTHDVYTHTRASTHVGTFSLSLSESLCLSLSFFLSLSLSLFCSFFLSPSQRLDVESMYRSMVQERTSSKQLLQQQQYVEQEENMEQQQKRRREDDRKQQLQQQTDESSTVSVSRKTSFFDLFGVGAYILRVLYVWHVLCVLRVSRILCDACKIARTDLINPPPPLVLASTCARTLSQMASSRKARFLCSLFLFLSPAHMYMYIYISIYIYIFICMYI